MKKNVVIIPDRFEKPIMALRISEWNFCKEFVEKGVIHFSNTKVWRDKTKSGEGQYDINEGCIYSCTEPIDGNPFLQNDSLSMREEGNVFRYYRSKDVFGCCFYGILRSSFSNEYITPWETKQKGITVSADYFSSFYPEISRISYEKMDERKRPGVIFIYDFWKIRDLIVEKLIQMGCNKNEILFGPVQYQKNEKNSFVNMPAGMEYFIKDSKYSSQHEYRFIINSESRTFIENLEQNNGNIVIGNLSDIAVVQPFYFDGFSIAIEGEKLIYQLAEPKTEHISEMDFKTLSSLLFQVQMNLLPQGKLQKEKLDMMTDVIVSELDRRFDVKYDKERGAFNKITLGQYEQLPEWYKKQRPFFPGAKMLEELESLLMNRRF